MKYQNDKIRIFDLTGRVFELESMLRCLNACLDEPGTPSKGHQKIRIFR